MSTPAIAPARYNLIETIGKGGMGEVCLADDLMLDRRVALKFLTNAADAAGALDQLVMEARAAAALDHPFICKIYEVADLGGRPCIVMEYVPGETLERRLRRGPLPLADALRLAEEIAEALEAAHKRRIVHRDLKPANVIVTEGDHIKVMDFGLATRLPPSAEAGGHAAPVTAAESGSRTLFGTPAYMSPEQACGAAVDRRSDVFAFGVLLYELLSGVQPFIRRNVEATLAAILEDTPADLHEQAPAVPPAASAVVARMLAKDPAERYQSFGDVRLDLRRLSGELGSQTAAETRSPIEPAQSAGRGPLIGREPERGELLRTIREAAAGRGGLVVLRGEAGAGKSRLAQEALAEARQLGFQTFVGRCYEQL